MKLYYSTWLYKLPKKKKSKNKLKNLVRTSQKLLKYAKRLESNLPNSEKWFRSLYSFHSEDLVNTPYGPYIPDVLNVKNKYIIEVDGSIHETGIQILKDRQKDQYFKKRGFKVFRVKAYSQYSYDSFIINYTKYMKSG